MKKALCILFLCALLTGCDTGPAPAIDDADKGEPIRIVATLQSTVPATPSPVVTLEPTKAPTPVPTETPSPAPAYTDTPEPTPAPDGTEAPETAPTATPDIPPGQQLAIISQQYLNHPYTRGGHSADTGFDPSGFVYWCLKEMGLDVKRRSSAGYAEEENWEKITRMNELEPGDLLFFRTGDNENINCVCIYLGENKMIYPSTSKQTVIISEINNYWINAFQWARRVF